MAEVVPQTQRSRARELAQHACSVQAEPLRQQGPARPRLRNDRALAGPTREPERAGDDHGSEAVTAGDRAGGGGVDLQEVVGARDDWPSAPWTRWD